VQLDRRESRPRRLDCLFAPLQSFNLLAFEFGEFGNDFFRINTAGQPIESDAHDLPPGTWAESKIQWHAATV
jgi:hypothetical protein